MNKEVQKMLKFVIFRQLCILIRLIMYERSIAEFKTEKIQNCKIPKQRIK